MFIKYISKIIKKTFGKESPFSYIRVAFRLHSDRMESQSLDLNNLEYIVYYGEDNATGHYTLWNPVFTKLGGRYGSIIRNAYTWWPYRKENNVFPVATPLQVERIIAAAPNLKGVFYPSNNGVNLHIIRHSQLRHIFIGHGDSNKVSSASKIFRLYDEVWTAGQAHIDRFSIISGDYKSISFKIVGQPWMQDWLKDLPKDSEGINQSWLYLPTWKGFFHDTSYSSLDSNINIPKTLVELLGNSLDGFIKPHPKVSKSNLTKLQSCVKNENLTILPPLSSIRKSLTKSTVFVVSDISAAVTECLYLNVPIFLYIPSSSAFDFKKISSDFNYCYNFSTENELKKLITDVILYGNDTLKHDRAVNLSYLVDIQKTVNGEFYDKIEEIS